MKSSWFGDGKRFEFAKLLQDAARNRLHHDVFRSFLTMAFCSMRQAVNKLGGPADPGIEKTYLAEVENLERAEPMAHALGVLTMALEERAYDFLGVTLSELQLVDKSYRGQCFTPASLCDVIARMTLQDLEPEQGKTLWLSEPACGCGAMLIAGSEVLQQAGFFPWSYHWTAVDVDWRCYAATYIQATLLGIPATIVHGNTLTLEEFDAARTIVGVLHPPKDRDAAGGSVEVSPARPAGEQMTLFD